MYLPHSYWQATVRDLLQRARLVILRTGDSSGLAWELETAVKLVPPQNLVLFLEPTGELPPEFRKRLPTNVPERLSGVRFLDFSADWTTWSSRSLRNVLKRKKLYRIQRKTVLVIAAFILLYVFIGAFYYALSRR